MVAVGPAVAEEFHQFDLNSLAAGWFSSNRMTAPPRSAGRYSTCSSISMGSPTAIAPGRSTAAFMPKLTPPSGSVR